MNKNYQDYKYNQKNYTKEKVKQGAAIAVEKRNRTMYIKFLLENIDTDTNQDLLTSLYYFMQKNEWWGINSITNGLSELKEDIKQLRIIRKTRIRDEKINEILND